MFSHGTIRRGEREILQTIWVHPGNTIVVAQTRSSTNRLRLEEEEPDRPFSVPVFMRTQRPHDAYRHPQFFPNLAHQAVFRRLARMNLATRKFPIPRKRTGA